MSEPASHALDPENLAFAAARFRALGEPTRLRLLEALGAGESSVGDLADRIGESHPNASRHLAALAGSGFVTARREAGRTLYRIADPWLPDICSVVCRSLADGLDESRSVSLPTVPEHTPGGRTTSRRTTNSRGKRP